MQFQFKIQIGRNEFTFVENAANHKDFFEKVSFFSGLPKVGPNGEDDLELVFRTTQQGHTYYSIVSKKADQEYKFGQSQRKPGELFGKGWEQLYHAGDENDEVSQVAAGGGIQAPQQNQQPVQQQQQFIQTQNPTPAPQTNIGVGFQPQMQTAPQPAQQPVQQQQVQQQPVQQQPVQRAPAPAPAANTRPAANPQVATQANNVLAKFLNN